MFPRYMPKFKRCYKALQEYKPISLYKAPENNIIKITNSTIGIKVTYSVSQRIQK